VKDSSAFWLVVALINFASGALVGYGCGQMESRGPKASTAVTRSYTHSVGPDLLLPDGGIERWVCEYNRCWPTVSTEQIRMPKWIGEDP